MTDLLHYSSHNLYIKAADCSSTYVFRRRTACQRDWSYVYTDGAGRGFAEPAETLWSEIMSLSGSTKYMAPANRKAIIEFACQSRNFAYVNDIANKLWRMAQYALHSLVHSRREVARLTECLSVYPPAEVR